MPKNRITKVTRTVTRTPKANKDPFYGLECVCTTVNPDIVNSIEEVLLKSLICPWVRKTYHSRVTNDFRKRLSGSPTSNRIIKDLCQCVLHRNASII